MIPVDSSIFQQDSHIFQSPTYPISWQLYVFQTTSSQWSICQVRCLVLSRVLSRHCLIISWEDFSPLLPGSLCLHGDTTYNITPNYAGACLLWTQSINWLEGDSNGSLLEVKMTFWDNRSLAALHSNVSVILHIFNWLLDKNDFILNLYLFTSILYRSFCAFHNSYKKSFELQLQLNDRHPGDHKWHKSFVNT